MTSFTTPLWITPAPEAGPEEWATARDFEVWIGTERLGWWLRIEAGYRTDLGSTPRFLWWLLPPHDPRFAGAFIPHDRLCDEPGFRRILADAIFLDLALVLAARYGAGCWRAYAMYAGLRLWALIGPLRRLFGVGR